MFKSLGLFIRLLIIISRDMLTGLIMGICSALLLFNINPGIYRTVALLVPIGIAGGILKGMAKVFFLALSGALPTPEYTKHYPKFKIIGFWLTILLGTLMFTFGLEMSLWISEPLRLLRVNHFMGAYTGFWAFLFSLVFIIGLISYFFEVSFQPEEQFHPGEMYSPEDNSFSDESRFLDKKSYPDEENG